MVNHDGHMLLEIMPCCLDRWLFGLLGGSNFQLLQLVMMLLIGPSLSASWLNWLLFLGSLHWPVGGVDLGVGGVSHVELLALHELWAGERLTLEKAHPRYLGPGRQFQCGLFRWCRH